MNSWMTSSTKPMKNYYSIPPPKPMLYPTLLQLPSWTSNSSNNNNRLQKVLDNPGFPKESNTKSNLSQVGRIPGYSRTTVRSEHRNTSIITLVCVRITMIPGTVVSEIPVYTYMIEGIIKAAGNSKKSGNSN